MKKTLHKLILISTILLGHVAVITAQNITAGNSSSVALCSNGTLMRWGYFIGGSPIWSPSPASGITDVVKIDANGNCYFAIKNDGTVWGSGINDAGGLGNGTNNSAMSPVQVLNLTNIVAVSSGHTHTLFLKGDGSVWASGSNTYGELGIGNNTAINVAVQIPTLSNITAVAAGRYHSVALKEDGTVWVWGQDSFSQLGNGSPFTASNIPLEVLGISSVTAIDAGMYFTHALKSDGTLWGWGQNYNGELGCGMTVDATIPVQTAGLTDIVSIADGYTHAFAIKNDGTVYGWGAANSYQLGNAQVATQYIPVVIPGLAGSIKIVSGEFHGLAVKNDGSVWSWGYNANGQLGNGSTAWNETPALVASSLCQLLVVEDVEKEAVATSIFPNPAKNNFQLKINTIYEKSEALIYNNIGSLIQTIKIDSENTVINIEGYAKGLYFVQITGNNELVSTHKVLVE